MSNATLCKPKMFDCLSCEKNTDIRERFCYNMDKCTVDFAAVKDGKILMYVDLPNIKQTKVESEYA